MRLSCAFLATLALATAQSLPGTCEDIPGALGDKPKNLHNYFNQEVCQKSKCTSTINEGTSFIEDTVFPKLFEQFAKDLGISSGNKATIQKISKEVSQAIQQSCSQQHGGKKVCDDDEAVLQYGQCALKAAEPVINKQTKKMQKRQAEDDDNDDDEDNEDDEDDEGSGLPSEEQCEKLEEVLTNEELWSKIIPGFIDQFAKQCKKN